MKAPAETGEGLSYADHLRILCTDDPRLAEELAAFHRVEDVLEWMQQRALCQTAVDIVGQDEFTYDFLVQLDSRWLAFGVT
jgi:hypothetical protein